MRRSKLPPGGMLALALAVFFLVLVGLPLLLSFIFNGGRFTSVAVGEATYEIPDSHVLTLMREPDDFLQIKPPEHGFELIYDGQAAGRTDVFGWPEIRSINEQGMPNVDRYSSGDLRIVCRRAAAPWVRCGFNISHRRAEWAVRFPAGQLAEAHAIRRQAIAALHAYESKAQRPLQPT